jgi:ribosomal protein S8
MQKWVVLCLLLEILSELKVSDKFNQHFTFLTGLIVSAVVVGGIFAKINAGNLDWQENLSVELQKWQKFSQSYELNEDLQQKLEKVEESYEKRLTQEQTAKMQEKFQDILTEYGYEISDFFYNQEEKKIVLTLTASEQYGGGKIKVDKIGEATQAEEEKVKREKLRKQLMQQINEEGDEYGVEIIFTKM